MGVETLMYDKIIMKYLIFTICLPLISSNPFSQDGNLDAKEVISKEVTLATFDGAEGTTFPFETMNDPVMGGVSISTFEINEEEHFGIFNGTVKIVPSLDAPGFCSMRAFGEFNDASSTIDGSIVVRVRSSSPDYAGYRMVFVDIVIPFTKFSDHWDPSTGNHISECSEDPKVCPTEKALAKITQIRIMSEGVAGDFHIEVESISAKA